MHKYLIRYLSDVDDANCKEFESKHVLRVGDVVQLSCGFYHCVVDVKEDLASEITVSESCQTSREALLVAKQLGHL